MIRLVKSSIFWRVKENYDKGILLIVKPKGSEKERHLINRLSAFLYGKKIKINRRLNLCKNLFL